MCMMWSFENIDGRKSPSLATKVATISSASVEDNAIVACFLVLHVLAPQTKVKTNPNVDGDVSLTSQIHICPYIKKSHHVP